MFKRGELLKNKDFRIKFLYVPLLVSLMLYIAIELFYFISLGSKYIIPHNSSNILNVIIIFLILQSFSFILGNYFKGTIVTSILLFIVTLINQVKIAFSSEPVYIKDIKYLNSPSTIGGITDGSIWPIIASIWGNILVFVIIAVGLGIFTKKFNYSFVSLKKRFVAAGCTIFILIFMFLPISVVNDMVIDVFFKVTYEKNNNTTTYVSYYNIHGVLAGMYGQYLTTMLREPEGYDKAEVEKMLDETKDSVTDKNFKKPNIIMVFSESFWDIDKQDTVVFDKKITQNYNDLKSKGMYVDMIAPVWGGISCNTEFEMLTGGTLSFFPECYVPYMDLYDSPGYEKAPSIINELNNNDYETTIVSAWGPSLFRCSKVYEYFKVNNTLYDYNLKDADIKGTRISDDYLADNIIETLNKKDTSKPLFHMTLTAEAHMPFWEDKFDEYDINVESSSLNEDKTAIVKSYAQGIYDADKMLKKLYDYIQTFDEPTILVFYGDHLPFLQTGSGENIFNDISYFNTGDTITDTFRKYNTGCLILDNYNLEYEKKEYMSPYLVMPYILNHMDISLSPYYKWLYSTIDKYPANNFAVSINSKGDVVPTNNLSNDETSKCANELAKMTWYMFVDNPKNYK